MAVADTLNTLITDLTNAYTTLENKGADIPTNKNTNNLAEAIQSLNVGNITTEVVKQTLTEEETSIRFNITSGKIPKLVILTSANYDTDGYDDLQSGEIRYVDYFADTNSGISETNNRVNGQTQFARAYNGANNVGNVNVTLTNTTVYFGRRSNTYYLADLEYKLTAYYWEDSQKLPTITATSDITTSQGAYNFLKQYAENDAYTIFTRGDGIDFRTLSDDSFGIFVILKTNNTPSGISAVTWKNNALRIVPYPESSAYALKLNEGEKVYRTVIPLDGKVYKDDSELVGLIEGTITEIENDNVTSIRRSAFAYCQSLTKIIVKNCLSVGRDGLSNNSRLTLADLGRTTSIENYAFDYCSRLDVVVLRNTTSVCSIQNNTFRGTKMASGGTGGTVYVPRDLVSSYQANASWSALAITFLAIEDNIATLEALGLNVEEFKS